jgi:tetratricopeptide (TPR) repeat protein
VLILLAFGVRSALGLLAQTNPHKIRQIISSGLLALILLAVGAVGLTQQVAIHTAQAHSFESQHNWLSAIDEYQLAGQSQPNSTDIARIYNEWGQQLLNQQNYSDALVKFTTVISNYDQATDQAKQAEQNSISAYQAWGNQASQQKDYTSATQHYDELMNQSYCNAPCQNQTSALDANAYYSLAEQKLAAQDYSSAVAAFRTLVGHFPGSARAKSTHGDYAQALWGLGQQQLTIICSNAVSTYQQLADQFADTTQGQQAATALKQPQAVKGKFTSTIPSGTNTAAVGLVQGVTPGESSDAFYATLAKSPVAAVNADGSFTFPSITLGNWDLVWGVLNSANNQENFYVGNKDGTFTYVAKVGPLCPYDFGNISADFPVA